MKKKTWFSLALASMLGVFSAVTARGAEIDLGAALPAVGGVDQDGKAVDLQKDAGKGFTLVYFYPKADTPGCTKQACSLRDGYAKLQDKGVRIYGVSGDDVESQKAFEVKYHLPFRLIADHEEKVMDAFGVPHHGTFATRQAFLFKDGKLVWRDLKAKTEQQAADVLAAIGSL
ncbi:MAG: peroxiredoxin [Acidobacteriota bacterium]